MKYLADAIGDLRAVELPSGLRILVLSYGKAPLFRAFLLVKAGGERDPEGKEGLADFTAEALTFGTRGRTQEELFGELEGKGASLRASSGWDGSVLGISGPEAFRGDFLGLLREILLEPIWPEEEVEKAKARRLAQLRELRDQAPKVADRLLWRMALEETCYAHPLEGEEGSIQGIGREDLSSFYSQNYLPGDMVLLLLGRDEPDALLSLASEAFGDIPPRGRGAMGGNGEPKGGRRVVLVDRPDLTQSEIRIALPGIARRDPRYHAFRLANYILGGGGFSSRLMERVRSQKGYTYGIRSSFYPLRIPGPLVISTFTPTQTTFAAFQEILSTLREFSESGPTERELEEAKGFFLGSFPLKVETPSQLAKEVLDLVKYDLDPRELLSHPERIKAVGKEEVLAIGREFLREEEMKVLVVGRCEAFARDFEALLGPIEVVSYHEVSP